MKPLAHMAPFVERFPEVAARETRVIFLPRRLGQLPAGEYGFIEHYCAEPTCDCRRVLFHVRRADQPETILATINYGWESEAFYARWLFGDHASARELREAALDPLNPQSPLAPAFLDLFRSVLLRDQAYVARLERHYQMFKRRPRRPPKP
ncbi:MAG: hypothetical protein ACYDH9_25680 [Limisphaerales bacterium]